MATKTNGSTFVYFSYGSNMLHEELRKNIPSAKRLGAGKLNVSEHLIDDYLTDNIPNNDYLIDIMK